MLIHYAWFIWTALILGVWFLVFIFNRKTRHEMLWASIWTAPMGLSEPLFVPRYWNPPSLFNLAQTTGFDLESIIFSFAVGGLGAVLYELLVKVEHIPINEHERHQKRHRFHLLAFLSPFIIFVILAFATGWNHIYCAIIAMFSGGIATLLCRPDLKKQILIGGLLFLILYFLYFFVLIAMVPGYVDRVWNLSRLSGILILGIPLEELLFAFTFGMMWSSIYEHTYWYGLKKITRA